MGEGYGPMLVATRKYALEEIPRLRIAIPGTLTTAYLTLRLFCPEIETALSPVVVFAPVDAISRDATRICFALHIEKRHAAVPLKYSFFVEARLSDRIPVAAYLVDAAHRRLPNADLVTHPVGERWTRHYCFDLPQTVADLDVRVTGGALHRRHPLWDTPTSIPSFNVAAPAG